MKLGVSVFVRVFVDICLLLYVSTQYFGLYKFPEALVAVSQLFLVTGLVVVITKGGWEDTKAYFILVILFFTIIGIVGKTNG